MENLLRVIEAADWLWNFSLRWFSKRTFCGDEINQNKVETSKVIFSFFSFMILFHIFFIFNWWIHFLSTHNKKDEDLGFNEHIDLFFICFNRYFTVNETQIPLKCAFTIPPVHYIFMGLTAINVNVSKDILVPINSWKDEFLLSISMNIYELLKDV